MAYELGRNDLEPLLVGGCFFGSGGGGTLISARHLAAHFQQGDYYPSDRVRVVTVAEAVNGESVMVAYMGAPEAIADCIYPEGPVRAVQAVQERLAREGRELAYVVPPESGALGFVVACLVAARLGLAVIDADGAGRAVPSLPMLTFAVGVTPRPAFLVSQAGLCVEMDVTPQEGFEHPVGYQNNATVITEQMLRPIVAAPQFGEFGGLAMWIMEPDALADALPIRGTLTRALTLGRALQHGQIESTEAMISFLQQRFGLTAYALTVRGRFVSADVTTTGGFDIGKVHLHEGDTRISVIYENESLLVWSSQSPYPLAMAPDSIAYFVEGPGPAVFSNGDVVEADGTISPSLKRRPVSLIAWQAESPLRKPGGLNLWSFMQLLQTIGYLGPYRAVGDINAACPEVSYDQA
ncbi:S-methyl thiohydantoin desulfurase domain-containing protein [Pseudomonas sp. MBLB4123]|uniref:S-methyl thiohydantoin desulfurase domain-containing protein n=1 Tax=Pseudomonas sp. MBLB4123 TaxID=3451557 RepID=UPI003F7540FB